MIKMKCEKCGGEEFKADQSYQVDLPAIVSPDGSVTLVDRHEIILPKRLLAATQSEPKPPFTCTQCQHVVGEDIKYYVFEITTDSSFFVGIEIQEKKRDEEIARFMALIGVDNVIDVLTGKVKAACKEHAINAVRSDGSYLCEQVRYPGKFPQQKRAVDIRSSLTACPCFEKGCRYKQACAQHFTGLESGFTPDLYFCLDTRSYFCNTYSSHRCWRPARVGKKMVAVPHNYATMDFGRRNNIPIIGRKEG